MPVTFLNMRIKEFVLGVLMSIFIEIIVRMTFDSNTKSAGQE